MCNNANTGVGCKLTATQLLRNNDNTMKPLLTLLFAFSYHFALGQLKYPSKQEVDKIIGLTISQKMTKENPSCEYGQCGEWWTANKDSTFYKADTVKFYNSSNIVYNDTSFCTSLVWDLGNGNTFNDSQANMCEEPPTRTIKALAFLSGQKGNVAMSNKYETISKDNMTYVIIYADQTVVATYKVIDLKKTTQQNLGDKSFCLTLVRQQ